MVIIICLIILYHLDLYYIHLLILLFFITACSSIPKNTQNSCAIFEERYLWYKHAKASGIDDEISRQLAFAPHINIGVFSLEKNSKCWSIWQKNLEKT